MVTVPLSPAPRRILIFKPSSIGDVVHTLPILNLIKRRWPAASISWLITPACAPLIEGHPQLDEVIQFNRKRYGHAWRSPTASTAFVKFITGLRERRFDWVLDFQGLFRSGWMTWAMGAPVRVGFDDAREGAPVFYTHAVSSGGWMHQHHAIGRYLHLAARLGCEMGPIEYHFPLDAADHQSAALLIPPATRFAALIPGSLWLTKQWPAEKFAELVKPIRERLGLACAVLGSADDAAAARQIGAEFNLAGRTTLRETIALLQRAELVIANDTGPMHIASALKRPLVALYGPTSPILTGPYGRLETVVRVDVPCGPCYGRNCEHRSCMKWLDVQQVLAAAEDQVRAASVAAAI